MGEEKWTVCLEVFAVAVPALGPVQGSGWTGGPGPDCRPVEAQWQQSLRDLSKPACRASVRCWCSSGSGLRGGYNKNE